VAGRGPGFAASAVSFVSLNFFFTRPFHTLRVDKTADLVALVVFLAVSAVTGTLLSMAIDQRSRAEQREREAMLLESVATRFLSGDAVDVVLRKSAQAVADVLGLSYCEIDSPVTHGAVTSSGHVMPSDAHSERDPEQFALSIRGHSVGRLIATPGGPDGFTEPDRNLLQAVASELAVSLEGIRLFEDARIAQLEAETNRLRAALFSSVTHDLRTPLASITASVTSLLAEDTALGQVDRRELLQTILEEAARLNRLVGNLMHLSRMRAGALSPTRSRIDLDEIIEGVIARLRPTLGTRKVKLVSQDNLPEVRVDVVQMDQAVTNLLENAVRHSPPGSEITIALGSWRESVQIRVSDQGPGVPDEDRERIFEAFVTGDAGTGTGLGLAITEAVVKAHGGSIRVEEAPGGGASFLVEIPTGGAG
jgi:two-component system sensor histidine kinase KdpD